MKNIHTVNKLISRELNFDEKLVESINSFFWKDVRSQLSNLDSTSVAIKHLGTITVSKRKVDQFIRMTIYKIRGIKKSVKYKESTKEIMLETHMNRLKKALIRRNELAKQYYEAYAKRANRILQTDTNDSE